MARFCASSISFRAGPGASFGRLLLFGVAGAALACGDGTATDGETGTDGGGIEEPDALVDWPTVECDPLVPTFCGFPFPSNVFTGAADTPTGRQLALGPEMMPVHTRDVLTDPSVYNEADGFSAAGYIMAHLPGATTTGLPTPDSFDTSLEAGSPTILLDAETGELVPHFTELDYTTADDDRRTLLVHPAIRLKDGHRYIVAVQGVVDEAGDPVPASAAFAALRDLEAYDGEGAESVESRRPLYADIFARLGDAGVERDGVQLAWDFTTASTEDITGDMVHMRDEALALGAISYQITGVDSDIDPANIAYRVIGTMSVPQYVENPSWDVALGERSSVIHYGDDGLPEAVGMHDVEWELLIPLSASAADPAALVQYGHGLFGDKEQLESSHFRSFMNEYNYAFFAVDWKGMSSEDEFQAGFVLNDGRIHMLENMMDRMQQGMLNALLSMRMMKDDFSQDPTYGMLIDPDTRLYHGISQGGILGAVYMALSTDVERGALGVMGQPYHLLLPRSVDFDPFFEIVRSSFSDPRDIQMMLAMTQILWNRAEPAGYTHHLVDDPLPDSGSKQIFMRAAIGDHQVTTLGAHHMARTIGIPHVDTGLRTIWGLENTTDPAAGGGYVEYGFGLPEDPWCNLPQDECDDPHGKLRRLDEARVQLDHFLRTGEVMNTCNGPCLFEDMSGCSEPVTDVCGANGG